MGVAAVIAIAIYYFSVPNITLIVPDKYTGVLELIADKRADPTIDSRKLTFSRSGKLNVKDLGIFEGAHTTKCRYSGGENIPRGSKTQR